MEKVWQAWCLVKPYLLGLLVVLVVAGAIWALIYVPKMQVPVCPPGQDGLPPKICFDIENEARRTLAYVMGGILAIIGIYMARRRIRALEQQVSVGQEQLKVAQEGQITERFTRAIEQLGSDKMEIRLGGIYALERIANDSDKDYWPIVETLTAYVRERAPWRGGSENKNGKESEKEPTNLGGLVLRGFLFPLSWQEPKNKPATDIQAALTVLIRRKYQLKQGELERLDLRNTDLRGANLRRANLKGAFLGGVHMEKVDLMEANLEGAIMVGAHLEGAFLPAANLKEGQLDDAHLEGANLIGTRLQKAGLRKARLQKAGLNHANLEGARLLEAHLEGADFKDAIGLTREQLAWASMDEKTILPDYLQEESREEEGPEGGQEE